MLSALKDAFHTFLQEVESRRQLRALLQKDDRLLRDVGLTRYDVEIALSRPYSVPAWPEARELSRRSLILDRAV